MPGFRPFGGLDDGKVEALMECFPTKVEYAGLCASAAAIALTVLAGEPVGPFPAAAFAAFASACLAGGAVQAEGARRGMAVEETGWLANRVGRM